MICTTYFLTFFSELIPPTGFNYILVLFKFVHSFSIGKLSEKT